MVLPPGAGPLLDRTLGAAICEIFDQDAGDAAPMTIQVTRATAPALLRQET